MPYPNEHAVRVADPSLFDKMSFRRKEIAPGISIIVAQRPGGSAMETQAYRFSANKFTFAQVKQWIKSHKVKHILMEAASGNAEHSDSVPIFTPVIEMDPSCINIDGFNFSEDPMYFDTGLNIPEVITDVDVICFTYETSLIDGPADILRLAEGAETVQFDDSSYIEKDAALFEVCERNGQSYTIDDLESMVKSFKEPVDDFNWSVPIQVDHSKSAHDTTGHLRQVWHDGTTLFGKLRFVGKNAVEKVTSGLWKKLSIGLSFFKNGLSKIREVSVSAFPYIETARIFSKDFVKGDENMEKDAKTEIAEITEVVAVPETTETTPIEESMSEVVEDTPAVETTVKTEKAGEKIEVAMSDTAPAVEVNMAAEIDRMKAEFAQNLETIKVEFQAKIDEKERIILFREREQVIVNFMDSGKTTPAMKDSELRLVQSFSDDQMKTYIEMKESQPAIVVFDTLGKSALKKPVDEKIDAKKEAAELLALVGRTPAK